MIHRSILSKGKSKKQLKRQFSLFRDSTKERLGKITTHALFYLPYQVIPKSLKIVFTNLRPGTQQVMCRTKYKKKFNLQINIKNEI